MPQLVFLLSSLLCVAHCQIRNHSLPIRLPYTPLNNSCPIRGDHVLRRLVRETLDTYHQDSNPPYHQVNNSAQNQSSYPAQNQSSYPAQNQSSYPAQNQSSYPPCSCGGDGSWTRAVHLNMSDMNQQCPSNWTLITNPIRGCGRKTQHRTCDSITYPVRGSTYSHVCGRILAYQKGWPSAFYNSIRAPYTTLEGTYMSGLSLTHGPRNSRQHIWSFVGGPGPVQNGYTNDKCPCSITDWSYQIPSFISNTDYFCDSGNPGPLVDPGTYYTDNPLWDGQGCGSNSACCEFNTPPWFCKSLPQPTSEDLEIRSCYSYESYFEDIITTLIDIRIK